MTREEAIARIKDHIEIHRYHERNAVKIFEALDMAIKALEQEPCEDTISRQNAIDALAKKMPSLTTPDGSGEFDHDIQIADEAFVDCVQIINELPSAQPEPQWIPCSERLPEKDELVLVTVWNDVTIAWRNIYGGWDSAEDMYEKGDVIAWMPLPEPYREDGELNV